MPERHIPGEQAWRAMAGGASGGAATVTAGREKSGLGRNPKGGAEGRPNLERGWVGGRAWRERPGESGVRWDLHGRHAPSWSRGRPIPRHLGETPSAVERTRALATVECKADAVAFVELSSQ